jgi:hypothetical protein
MEFGWEAWKGMPAAARYALVALTAGWACHYGFYFRYFAENFNRTDLLQLAVGIGICYCVATAKKWARALCIFFNIGIIALYGLMSFMLLRGDRPALGLWSVLVAALFVAATVLLLHKDTSRFFNPPAAGG